MKNKLKRIYDLSLKTTYLMFLYGVGIFLPLYFQDYYFDIMEAKAYGYYLIIKYISIFVIFTLILKIINNNHSSSNSFLTYSLVLFLISTLISSLFSRSFNNALSGLQGWYIGLFAIGTLILIIIILKDTNSIPLYFYIPVIIAVFIVYITTILHSFEIDFLSLHNNILEDSYHKYLSTIGNINWYAGYLSLTIPFFASLYLKEDNKIKTSIYAIMSFLGVMCVAFLGSDSIYLALGIMSFFAVPYIFWNKEYLKRFSYLMFVFISGLLIARYLDYCMDGFAAITRQLKFILPCVLIAIITYVLSIDIKNKKFIKYRKKIIFSIEFSLFIVFISLLIYAFINNSGDWATGRTLLWKETFNIFSNYSLKQKLFGVGPEMLNYAYADFNNKYQALYLTSHSEPIQTLATLGIFGLTSWLMCWCFFFKNYICTKAWQSNKLIPFYLSLFAYFGQSLINSATTLNVATLSLLIIGYYIYSNN